MGCRLIVVCALVCSVVCRILLALAMFKALFASIGFLWVGIVEMVAFVVCSYSVTV